MARVDWSFIIVYFPLCGFISIKLFCASVNAMQICKDSCYSGSFRCIKDALCSVISFVTSVLASRSGTSTILIDEIHINGSSRYSYGSSGVADRVVREKSLSARPTPARCRLWVASSPKIIEST